MKLSIIVLTCNQKSFTLRLLETLAPWLAANPDSELIVVDNGSSDSTLEAIRRMETLPRKNLTLIYNEKNLGVAGGRNVGLRRASGKYILILDNDTEVTSEAIDYLIGHLESHKQCGLCAPALISPDGMIQESAKPFPSPLIKLAHLLKLSHATRSEKEAMKSSHPFYVIGACQMFRGDILKSIGLLDDNIFYGPEDADWCMRIREAGYSIDYLPEASIIHKWQRATNRSPFSRLSRLHFKALVYFYFKHRRIR